MMFLRVNIWSVHDRPRRKPTCSSQRHWSAAPLSWQSSMVKKAFPLTESRVIPRQFVYSIMLPSFGSLRMMPFCQFSGTAIHSPTFIEQFCEHICNNRPSIFQQFWLDFIHAGWFVWFLSFHRQTDFMLRYGTFFYLKSSQCFLLLKIVCAGQCFPEVFDSTSILLFFGHQKFVILYSV